MKGLQIQVISGILFVVCRGGSRPPPAHSRTLIGGGMSRSIRSSTLETRSARLRLPVSKVPVFVKIGPRIGLGYRRNHTAGTWVVRLSDGNGRNARKAIGSADDYEEAD